MMTALQLRACGFAAALSTCLSLSAASLAKPAVSVLGSYDGVSAESGLVIDPQNERILYGATARTFQSSCGEIYKIELSNDAAAKIVSFSAFKLTPPIAPHGCEIKGDLVFHNGMLYGVLSGGKGSIFKYDRSGNFGIVYQFAGSANGPAPGLVADGDGNLYGTTTYGGANNLGVVFKVNPNTGAFTAIASLGGAIGGRLLNGLVFGPDGWLYGVTTTSPAISVFKVSTGGELKIVHTITGRALPQGRLSFDAVGNLYGTSVNGGTDDRGFIYKVTAEGKYSVVYNFPKGGSGLQTSQRITIGQDGFLYGASSNLFRLNPIGYAFEILHSFAPSVCSADLTVDSQGRLYGAIKSVLDPHTKFEIFRVTP